MAFRRRTKSYPLFSQEFVIHNHADIGFCLVLCVLIGLMFEVTAKTAFLFILPQYNVSVPTADGETVHYHYGPKDLVTVLFYIFITIILHAVVQEYILDKISKRLHLSKVKHSKFNESGQLVVFHLSSVIWCFYVVVTEGYLTNPRSLWEDYPHVYLPFQVKFFYLCQLAYWLHALPELYFQKVRKEEIPRQLQYICLYLVHVAGAYLLNLSRLGLVLLLLQYSTEFLFHTARLCYFADENNEKLFNAWAAAFGVTRLFILTLAVLAIGFGLARVENQAFDPEKGNFNTLLCSCGTGASTGASRAPSAECPPRPGWQPGSSRGSRVLGRSPPAPRSLSSLGAVCTRLCFLSRRPLSRLPRKRSGESRERNLHTD
ncbi:translocating chain-associated membrane protein 2 isoform X3 [Balaenoptera musculus]|uniref:Translocating chain-associated membrane protein 2 isoform X3 n=1 Tax=Balaenoptera musculus TaxID=9771 RepID=A0A8B8YTC1_BALMU|nr:translocating chain-associated membrane protein 2 isoform X3 [Balaenoptera musculus]